jgi:hypothetical protein
MHGLQFPGKGGAVRTQRCSTTQGEAPVDARGARASSRAEPSLTLTWE